MYDDILGKKEKLRNFDELMEEIRENAYNETTKLAVFLQDEFGRYLNPESPVDNAIRLLKKCLEYENWGIRSQRIICAECEDRIYFKQKGE